MWDNVIIWLLIYEGSTIHFLSIYSALSRCAGLQCMVVVHWGGVFLLGGGACVNCCTIVVKGGGVVSVVSSEFGTCTIMVTWLLL